MCSWSSRPSNSPTTVSTTLTDPGPSAGRASEFRETAARSSPTQPLGRLGHESYVTTLTIYAGYIIEEEGGKAVPLARPTASTPAPAASNVVPFRRRSAG